MSATSKTCTKCGETKPASEFHPRRDRPIGLTARCRTCRNEAANVFRDSGRNRLRLAIWSHYRLTLDDWDRLLAKQGGGCAICGAKSRTNGKRLLVDHDHLTGEVRGLLCQNCNHAIGAFFENPDLLLNALKYIGWPAFRKKVAA